jgi:hypothetical protein
LATPDFGFHNFVDPNRYRYLSGRITNNWVCSLNQRSSDCSHFELSQYFHEFNPLKALKVCHLTDVAQQSPLQAPRDPRLLILQSSHFILQQP